MVVADSTVVADSLTVPKQTQTFGGATELGWSNVVQSDVAEEEGGTLALAEVPGFTAKTPALSAGRAWGTAAAYGDKIYVIGGGTIMGTMESTDEILEYDPATDTLTKVANLPYGLNGTRAVTAADGKIYVVMGEDPSISATYEARVLRFDPLQGTVEVAVQGMYAAYHHAAALGNDGLIYAFGGYGSGPLQSEIEAFDPVQGQIVSVAASLPVPREKLAAFAAPNGKIYIFGGADVHADAAHEGGQITDQILKFDPASTSLESVSTATLPQPLINITGGVLSDGAIYLVGGDAPSGTTTVPTTAVYRFDPQTETITTVADQLPAELSGAAAAVGENGKLYVFGGRSAAGLDTAVLELRPFSTVGLATCPVIDTGVEGTPWSKLDWSAQVPDGTTLKVEVRAADSEFAPDDSSLTWQLVTGPPVTSDLPSARYLQWRATLKTVNTAVTPKLDQVSLTYGD
jgi:N-acetylneuraminic acid mutarotase